MVKQDFCQVRDNFDKLLRRRQRAYRRGLLIEIEDCDTTDPRRFWKHINKLGPKKNNSIPWEVYDPDGNVVCDKDVVLATWEKEYNSLLNSNDGVYDESFLSSIQAIKAHRERNMLDPLYISNYSLNKALELDEVRKIVNGSKCGKATGLDGIPNEVLKK